MLLNINLWPCIFTNISNILEICRTSPLSSVYHIDSLGTSQKLELQREKWERKNLPSRSLSRRSISKERWVETLVVADTKMIEYHGSENVESYILTIMNMVCQTVGGGGAAGKQMSLELLLPPKIREAGFLSFLT